MLYQYKLLAHNAERAVTFASAGIVPGQIESNKYSLGTDSKGPERTVLRQRLRITNQLLGIGLRDLCGSNRLVDVTAQGLHVRKQLFAEFIECVASGNWRYYGSDRVFAPYR